VSQKPDRNVRVRRWLGGWPPAPSLLVGLLVLLAGCTISGEGQRKASFSETGYPGLLLMLDESEQMGGDPTCISRKVSSTEVVGPVVQGSQGASGRWTERWIVDRCGSLVPYLVKFARAADGDLDVTMQLEPLPIETTAVPGSSIADLILQRDAVGFLSQRDFAAAGPEGTCDGRKVIDTEVVQPLEGATVEGDRPMGGQWVERWTLKRLYSGVRAPAPSSAEADERCGKPVRYLVRFSTTPKGTTFTVEEEKP
jgi:hypothetical protein